MKVHNPEVWIRVLLQSLCVLTKLCTTLVIYDDFREETLEHLSRFCPFRQIFFSSFIALKGERDLDVYRPTDMTHIYADA